MSESSTSPPADGDPFDVEQFARDTIHSIEFGDEIASVLEARVIRLEQIIAARWPRSMVLRWRFAREIRASVASWDDRYIPRDDFCARRFEAVSQEAGARHARHLRARAERDAEERAEQPGEGFLP